MVISLLLILLVTDMVYSYGRCDIFKRPTKENILYLQIFLTGLFILLYIVSNIPYILGESADFVTHIILCFDYLLFSLAGVVSGVYLAGFLINFNRWISVLSSALQHALLTLLCTMVSTKWLMEFCIDLGIQISSSTLHSL